MWSACIIATLNIREDRLIELIIVLKAPTIRIFFLRYLKKLSEQALSKGYPFLEKDCTTLWLAEQPCTPGGIRGYRRRGHPTVTVRYDPKTNDLVVADINTGIYTMFKPSKGKAYFEQRKRQEE